MDEIQKRKYNRNKYIMIGLGIFTLIIITLISAVGTGAMQIGFNESMGILFGKITNHHLSGIKENVIAVVWEIRTPRVLCGLFVGMGLSVAGAIFQSLLGNPLADPYTLGISTGAAFGASLAILLNILYGLALPTTVFAFGFAMLTMMIVLLISKRSGVYTTSSLIISGIIIGSILSAGISFIKMTAGEDVSAIVFWIMGNLVACKWIDVLLLMPTVLTACIFAYAYANDLNIMTLGDKGAQALGVDTKKTRLIYMIIGSSLTAVCVSVSGVIGFVGLVVPHLLRMWLTADNRVLIPLSALFGGLLMMIADNVTRLFSNGEIPVGVLTTLFGGPFFLFVYLKGSRRCS